MPGNRAARFWSTACASASGWSKWVQSLRDALGRRLAQSNPRPRRFNEAPIHESGKCATMHAQRIPIPGLQ